MDEHHDSNWKLCGNGEDAKLQLTQDDECLAEAELLGSDGSLEVKEVLVSGSGVDHEKGKHERAEKLFWLTQEESNYM